MNPYCFIITSFSTKQNLKDLQAKFTAKDITEPVQNIDFDKIYEDLVKPAVVQAGMEPLIEKEEASFGSIHKTMYEKIILCEFCVADLTNLNPNAYYELGMRYAVRPYTTIPIIASSHFPLPFDIGPDRTFAYQVNEKFELSDKENDIKKLSTILIYAKQKRSTDSPLYDLVNGISFQNSVSHEKTDVFRDKVEYDTVIKQSLAYARELTDDDPGKTKSLRVEALNKIVEERKPLENLETGVLIDMMISYRNIEAFEEMMNFIEQLPRYVFETVMVQEQYAFILNRNGGKKKPVDMVMIKKAEDVLGDLEKNGKASSETYGIWGRIFKDKFERAYNLSNKGEAKVQLKNALRLYEKGFEFDMRDAYPGVNYVTCLELSGDRQKALRVLPAVEYSVLSNIRRKEKNGKQADYWDKATLVELAVIENKFDEAKELFYEAKSLMTETWMAGTTKGNLDKIISFRKERGEETAGAEKIAALFA